MRSTEQTLAAEVVGHLGIKEVLAVSRQVLCNHQKLVVTLSWCQFPACDSTPHSPSHTTSHHTTLQYSTPHDTHHTTHTTRHTPHDTHHTTHTTRHTAHTTRHTPHDTHHMTHTTRHTPHGTHNFTVFPDELLSLCPLHQQPVDRTVHYSSHTWSPHVIECRRTMALSLP